MVSMQSTDSATTTAPAGRATDPSLGDGGANLVQGTDLLWFGGVILLVFAIVYVAARLAPAKGLTGPSSYVTFARLYGLVSVALLAVLLTFSSVADDARTAAFAVLGTIAGYLAGASSTSTKTTQEPTDSNPTTEVTQSSI